MKSINFDLTIVNLIVPRPHVAPPLNNVGKIKFSGVVEPPLKSKKWLENDLPSHLQG